MNMDRKTAERANEIIMRIKDTEKQIDILSYHSEGSITFFEDIPISVDELNQLIASRKKIKAELEKELEELH